jgi:hypothetical protein
MKKPLILILLLWGFTACHRKTAPPPPPPSATVPANKTPVRKTPVPKTIVVNDMAATKTPDGRLYYDLNGKRYWKNFRDGKYYLFRKGMLANPDFKP